MGFSSKYTKSIKNVENFCAICPNAKTARQVRGRAAQTIKKKRECLLHSLCVPNCSRRTRSRQEADPWGFCPISGYLFNSGGLSLLQLPFSLAALWIGSYSGRSWTFRCLPTAAPHLSAPSKLGAYSVGWHQIPSFSIFIIAHSRVKVKGFCEKILIFFRSPLRGKAER